MELSGRNQLPGEVVSVKLGGIMAEVTIRLPGGEEIVAAITRSSTERLGLEAGQQVVAIIKATEVMIGKP